MCFFVKQKTAYEMRISYWSSDVCSSELGVELHRHRLQVRQIRVENLAVEDEADIAQCRFGQAETGFALDGHGGGDRDSRSRLAEIGRASCRDSVCQYG